MRKPKTIRTIEEKMNEVEKGTLRHQVLEAVGKFKGNWFDLGRCLNIVDKTQAYKDWGYATLKEYCGRELKLRSATVKKLIFSYRFMEKEESGWLSAKAGRKTGQLPDYENIDILRKARSRKQISQDDYEQLHDAVFKAEVPTRELGRRYRSLLQAAREETGDPEKEWEKQQRQIIKRTLGSLRKIKGDLEETGALPRMIVSRLGELIKQIEDIF